MKLMYRKGKGFTLIELLVVISVLGVMAAVILVAMNNVRSKARDARRVANLSQIAKALELYYSRHGSYPAYHAWSTAMNWYQMMEALKAEGLIADNFDHELVGLENFHLIPTAHAKPEDWDRYQDPSYPERTLDYTTSRTPPNQNFRLRAQLENLNHSALGSGISGKFSSEETTGSEACDKSLGYYCVGGGTNQPFVPWPN